MSVAENKARIEHFVKFFRQETLDQYLELYDPNVVLHGYPPDLPPGLTGARAFYTGLVSAFPDSTIRVDLMVGEGDYVACHYTMRATHQESFWACRPPARPLNSLGRPSCVSRGTGDTHRQTPNQLPARDRTFFEPSNAREFLVAQREHEGQRAILRLLRLHAEVDQVLPVERGQQEGGRNSGGGEQVIGLPFRRSKLRLGEIRERFPQDLIRSASTLTDRMRSSSFNLAHGGIARRLGPAQDAPASRCACRHPASAASPTVQPSFETPPSCSHSRKL